MTRSTKRKALEEAGLRKKKCHSPDPASVTFDKEGLLQEVNSMTKGEKVRINCRGNTNIIHTISCCRSRDRAQEPLPITIF